MKYKLYKVTFPERTLYVLAVADWHLVKMMNCLYGGYRNYGFELIPDADIADYEIYNPNGIRNELIELAHGYKYKPEAAAEKVATR
jgi:hypothetical protein